MSERPTNALLDKAIQRFDLAAEKVKQATVVLTAAGRQGLARITPSDLQVAQKIGYIGTKSLVKGPLTKMGLEDPAIGKVSQAVNNWFGPSLLVAAGTVMAAIHRDTVSNVVEKLTGYDLSPALAAIENTASMMFTGTPIEPYSGLITLGVIGVTAASLWNAKQLMAATTAASFESRRHEAVCNLAANMMMGHIASDPLSSGYFQAKSAVLTYLFNFRFNSLERLSPVQAQEAKQAIDKGMIDSVKSYIDNLPEDQRKGVQQISADFGANFDVDKTFSQRTVLQMAVSRAGDLNAVRAVVMSRKLEESIVVSSGADRRAVVEVIPEPLTGSRKLMAGIESLTNAMCNDASSASSYVRSLKQGV